MHVMMVTVTLQNEMSILEKLVKLLLTKMSKIVLKVAAAVAVALLAAAVDLVVVAAAEAEQPRGGAVK